jgi:rubrerythrin
MAKKRHAPVVRDTAALDFRSVLFGGGTFDVASDHPNKKGWDIFELGQKSFWAVPSAIAWDEPVHEDPRYAQPIAAMLEFLCPGEKAAVTGASLISTLVPTEEAKFYFAEQALEEAKHYDALRRLIPMISGRPLAPPNVWVRLLYSFGVVDKSDVAFMMGSINIIGEHLANQIFHKIAHVAVDPAVQKILGLIGRDEARHIGAGQRFFPEVFDQFKKTRHKILAKNLATTIVLAIGAHDLVGPMRALDIRLEEILEAMYRHYSEITRGLPAFPEQALLETLLKQLRWATPLVIRTIGAMTDEHGEIDAARLVALCERAIQSPRHLRDLFAGRGPVQAAVP